MVHKNKHIKQQIPEISGFASQTQYSPHLASISQSTIKGLSLILALKWSLWEEGEKRTKVGMELWGRVILKVM